MLYRFHLLTLVFLAATVAQADTLGVPSQFATIQDAMNAAQIGDTVLVADGTYTGAGNTNMWFNGKAIAVRSENGAQNCIIDCQGTANAFWFAFDPPGVVVDGFTITNAGDSGMYMYYEGDPTILNCIIAGNAAAFSGGGGIRCEGANPTITNCTITGNSAIGSGSGGGILCSMSSPTIRNCVIAGNTAAGSGGGVYCSDGSNPTIIDSIVWGNGPDQFSLDGFSAIVVSYSNVDGGWLGEGNTDADPLFVDPAGNDYHLSPDSTCMDAGDPDFVPQSGETDIDGEPRVMGCRVDMGVDEMTAGQPNSGDLNADGVADLLDAPLFVNALLATPDPADACVADMNGDGSSNGLDIERFVTLLLNGP